MLFFSEITKILNFAIFEPFAPAFILTNDSALVEEIAKAYLNVVVVDFQPTCENLAVYFAHKIKENLPSGVRLYSVKLYETPTSFVEWISEDNQ